MKCLVTGAAGGIGHHLCNYLVAAGHDVLGIDNYSVGKNKPMCTVLNIDVATEWLPLEKYDWIFHLAALADIVPSITAPGAYHDANVTGTVKMLEYARKTGSGRFIYAASSSCYGIPKNYPTDERSQIQPQYPYALTKYLGEQYVLHYAKVYGLKALSLRLFNVYGPGFRTAGTYGAVFGVFLSQLANGQPLTVIGDGTQRRDFTFVTDVVEAMTAAAASELSGEIFNVGGGKYPYTINNLVEFLGSPKTINIPKRSGEPDMTFAAIGKIKRMLGWEPRVDLRDGVIEMLKYLNDYKDAPLWTPKTIQEITREWQRCLGS